MKGPWEGYSDYYQPGPKTAPGTYSANNFAKNLEELLEQMDLTQAEAAKRCGISQATINMWLTGTNTPNVYGFALLCDNLGIEPNWMLSKHQRLK